MGRSLSTQLFYGIDFGERLEYVIDEDFDDELSSYIDQKICQKYGIEYPEWPSEPHYPQRYDYDHDDSDWQEKFDRDMEEWENHPETKEYKRRKEQLKSIKENEINCERVFYGVGDYTQDGIALKESEAGFDSLYQCEKIEDIESVVTLPDNADQMILDFCDIIGIMNVDKDDIGWYIAGTYF
jgi:hypothetical protein